METDRYGKRSGRKKKKENKNKMVNIFARYFGLQPKHSRGLNGVEGLCGKPKYRANIIHNFIFVSILFFPITPSTVRIGLPWLNFKISYVD